MKVWTPLSRARKWWLKPVGLLEGGEVGGKACQGAVVILHPQKLLGPGGGVLVDRAS